MFANFFGGTESSKPAVTQAEPRASKVDAGVELAHGGRRYTP